MAVYCTKDGSYEKSAIYNRGPGSYDGSRKLRLWCQGHGQRKAPPSAVLCFGSSSSSRLDMDQRRMGLAARAVCVYQRLLDAASQRVCMGTRPLETDGKRMALGAGPVEKSIITDFQ